MANEFKVRKSLVVNGSGSVLFDVQGSQGQLFSITDSLSGSLFAVKDISGIPVMEAFSDNTVRMGQFGQKALFVSQSRVGIGKESALTATLDVSGSATVTGSLNVSGSILQNGGALAVQDGTILYHNLKWFTPSSTVSTSGTTVTSVGTQFTSGMIGAKLTISGESRLITAFTSNTQVTVASSYSQNYSGVASGSWGVYSRSFANVDNFNAGLTNVFYDSSGNQKSYFDPNGNLTFTSIYTIANNTLSAGTFFSFGTAAGMRFSSANNDSLTDVRLRRISSGLIQIDDGSSNSAYRDLLLRNITGSNATFSGSLLVNGTSTLSGSLAVTGSSTFTGPVNITSGSLTVASASLAVSGSLSINGVNITATGGFQQTFSAATTWVVTHNLNTLYPVITVYNGSGQVIIPTSITATDVNTTTVTFNTAVAGTINIISGQLQQNIAVSNPTAVALSTVLGG
jgi:autotransporter-associated beta strand protein